MFPVEDPLFNIKPYVSLEILYNAYGRRDPIPRSGGKSYVDAWEISVLLITMELVEVWRTSECGFPIGAR